MTKKTNKTTTNKVAVGAGLIAAGAAAYMLLGPNGDKNRKDAKAWGIKMKKEIAQKIEKAKDASEPVYKKIVEEVSEKYAKLKSVDEKELKSMASSISKQWKSIQKVMKPSAPRKTTKAKKK